MFKVKKFEFEYRKNDSKFHLSCPDLEFEKGEIYLIKGENGSGKSTLLNLFSGYFFNKDFFEINGISSKDRESYRMNLGYVSDNDLFPDDLIGKELLDLSSSLFNLTREQKNDNLRIFKDKFPIIENLLKNKARTFSLGQRKMMSFVFRLINLPSLVICDEPFIGLDSKNSKSIEDLLKFFVESGKCVLYSSNNSGYEYLGNETILIEDGVVKKL